MRNLSTVNARFWVYGNAPALITLEPGQRLVWSHGHAHEEGYSFREIEWSYNDSVHDPGIHKTTTYGGRDCDGYMHTTTEQWCSLHNLRDIEHDDALWPRWELCEGHGRPNPCVYDATAQAAGY